MIPQLLDKVQPFKEKIIHDDILREYYNLLKNEDRAFLLIGLASGYIQSNTLLDDMMKLVKNTYINILSDDITAFTAVKLDHNAYNHFFNNEIYFSSRTKFDLLYSIVAWISKNHPSDQPIQTDLLENITLSFMLLFIFDNIIDIPDNIVTFVDALGSENV